MEKCIATVDETRRILTKYCINPKERYGQNFLVSPKIPTVVSEHKLISSETLIIEIGPGLGSMTQFLLKKAKKVICYEIDSSLCQILNETFSEESNIEIINCDFLKIDLNKIDTNNYSNVVIVSNLPYYITSDILCKIFLSGFKCDCIAMMQKEVAHRILNKNDINELVLCSHLFNSVNILTEVSKNDFFPKPKVDSTVLVFKQKPLDTVLIKPIIGALFSNRRKTIYNNLKCLNGQELHEKFIFYIMKECNLSQTNRIDDFNLDQIIQIILKIKSIIYLKAPSKINIGLNITGKKDNLHVFESIFYPYEKLCDYIEFYITKTHRISVEFYGKITKIENDSITKSLMFLNDHLDEEFGTNITVHKNIPIGSGLGGGSSDCGTVLKAISKVFNIEKELLIDAALSSGTDSVYFLNPIPAIMIDFRTYKPIELLPISIDVVLNEQEISTKQVFDKYDELSNNNYSQKSIYKEKFNFADLKNDLESSILALYPPLLPILSTLRGQKYDFVEFSGSGPSIVCIKDLTKS